MQHQKNRSGTLVGILLPMGLVCLFAFCSLALALMGGQAYKQIQNGVDESFSSTVAASYLRTKLSQSNPPGDVFLQSEEGVQMLVIRDRGDENVFETRIYMYDGSLVESYVAEGAPFMPQGAIRIAQLQSCEFAIDEDGLFTADIVSPEGVHIQTAFAVREGGNI